MTCRRLCLRHPRSEKGMNCGVSLSVRIESCPQFCSSTGSLADNHKTRRHTWLPTLDISHFQTRLYVGSNPIIITCSVTLIWQSVKPHLPAHSQPVGQRDKRQEAAIRMISDDELYRIAVFLGCSSMVLIVLYHFIDLNAKQDEKEETSRGGAEASVGKPAPTSR
jgi:oligosaccharyl transferase complex subunit OST4